MDIERRFIAGGLELRADEDKKKKTMVGYAAKFNSRSLDLGGFVEVLAPGAFDRALNENHDVRALIDHNPTLILGRTASGTLRLAVDGTGLMVENDLPDTQAARDLMVSMERGDVTGMSFGFRVMPDGDHWARDEEGALVRTVNDLELRAAELGAAPLERLAREIRNFDYLLT
jgi:HK97 family phage prohead protease